MNMGSPFLVNNANASFSLPGDQRPIPPGPEVDADRETRSDVRIHFMRMMEAHDRIRARLLGSSHAESYAISGD
ncbi:MAG TPA: hypothetical protein VJU86_01900 [Pyrinomonadaceae bacterium]|nr:hypothetical protein [Pyrinomonadaceae bacterium]